MAISSNFPTRRRLGYGEAECLYRSFRSGRVACNVPRSLAIEKLPRNRWGTFETRTRLASKQLIEYDPRRNTRRHFTFCTDSTPEVTRVHFLAGCGSSPSSPHFRRSFARAIEQCMRLANLNPRTRIPTELLVKLRNVSGYS